MGKVVLPKGAVPALGVRPGAMMGVVRPVKPADSPEPAEEPDLRLIIEDSEEAGGVVYTVVDRRSGKVVSRLSRADVLRLRQASGYAAGGVFDGRV